MSSVNKKNSLSENKQEVVSITYEEIGLFPRSFSRVLDRFLKQVFSDVENLVIQEYRFYRYLFLTTLKWLFILFFVPFSVNILARTYVVRPLTEYFWNTKQPEIFLNSYQQKHAFAELKDFEEKLYFESLIYPKSAFQRTESSNSQDSVSSKTNLNITPQGNEETVLAKGFKTEGSQKTEGLLKEKNAPLYDRVYSSSVKELKGDKNETISDNLSSTPSASLSPLSLRFSSQASGSSLSPVSQGMGKTTGDNETPTVKIETPSIKESVETRESKENQMGMSLEKTESLINSYTLKSSLFVYQTIEADKNIQQRYQEKTIELAQRYNDQSIEAITNFFADLISLFTLFYLLYALEIQINITKSFLLEVFFGLDDSKKSLLILLITDLLVGYHSSNLWELFFEFLFHHYGLPESQTGIFLLVATLPVLLDVLFKYLIFRHLNRSSPATVATYHAMIE